MSLRVHTCETMIGAAGRESVEMPWRGDTFRQIAQRAAKRWPAGTPTIVASAGRVIEGRDLDRIAPDGAHIAVAPQPGVFSAVYAAVAASGWFAATLVATIVSATVLAVAGYAYQKLVAQKPNPLERGDDESPANSWDGLRTAYGTGWSIPIACGEVLVPGQVIGSRIYQVDGFPNTEALDLLIALSYGRIESVGGIIAGTKGEADRLGVFADPGPLVDIAPLPSGILANDIAVGVGSSRDPFGPPRVGATASLRMGEIRQSPIDDFPGAQLVTSVFGTLDRRSDSVAQLVSGVGIVRASIRLAFPAGLYRQINGGQPTAQSVRFALDWRRGDGAWSSPRDVVIEEANRTRFAVLLDLDVTQPGNDDDLTVRVTRISPDPTGGPIDLFVTDCVLQDVTTHTPGQFAYPEIALLRLGLLANEQLQGTTPSIKVPVKGIRVTVYDESFGFATTWERPTTGNFAGIWMYPPGRNPAWIMLTLLLRGFGLGNRLSVTNVDVASLRDLADWCDKDIDVAPTKDIALVSNTTPIVVTVLNDHGLVTGDRVRIEGVGGTTAANGTWYVTALSSGIAFSLDGSVGNGAYTSGGTATKQGAQFTYDKVIDTPQAAYETILEVLGVCRAVPIPVGDRLGFAYEYDVAHGRGTNSVPVRSRMQLVNTANCEDFELIQRDGADRPNTYLVQFLNREMRFERDVTPVEDVDAFGLQEPHVLDGELPITEALNLSGITDVVRARREAVFAHRVNRLCATEVRLVVGVDQLAVRVKDIIGVQHDVMRPHATEAFGWRTSHALTAQPFVRIDHEVTIDSGTGATQVMYVDPDGVVQTRTVTMADDTYAAGAALLVDFATEGNVTVARGVPITVGFEDALVRDYVVTSILRRPDGKREIRGVEWHPEAFEVPATNDVLSPQDFADDTLEPSEASPAADGITLDVIDATGQHVARWQPAAGYRPSAARVYVGRRGAPWRLHGQTPGDSLALTGLEPHREYEIRVATSEDGDRGYHSPGAITPTIIRAPEFPALSPADVPRAGYALLSDSLLLHWGEVVDRELDYYEIRRGSHWVGAEIVGRTRETRLVLTDVPHGEHEYRIRARLRAGVYGGSPATVVVPDFVPHGLSLVSTVDDLVSGAAGTATSTEWHSDGYLRLAASAFDGTYLSAILDAGSVADRLWSARVDQRWVDVGTTVADADDLAGSGEARWAMVHGREPSSHLAGADLDTLVEDIDATVSDASGLVRGPYGSIGHHARVTVEVRYDESGSLGWSEWMPYRAQRREARRVQLRLRLSRRSATYDPRVSSVELAAVA